MKRVVPAPLSQHRFALYGGASMVVRQHGNTAGPRLLLSHGNGLAIDAYYPFWSLLEQDYELILYDLRNHGWNSVSDVSNHNVVTMVQDLDEVLYSIEQRWGRKPITGVFHSFSAMISLLFTSPAISHSFEHRSHGLDALVLFDPPLHRPGHSHSEFDAAVEQRARAVRNRIDRFSSREQFLEMLEFFPSFSRLVPGARELLAQHILKPSESQDGFELRCPKLYEARIVEYIRAFADRADFDHLKCPTKIIGSDPQLPFSYLPTVDFSAMLRVDFDFIPDTTHYVQLENPARCAQYVHDFVTHNKLM